jgi:hypothetical protein
MVHFSSPTSPFSDDTAPTVGDQLLFFFFSLDNWNLKLLSYLGKDPSDYIDSLDCRLSTRPALN